MTAIDTDIPAQEHGQLRLYGLDTGHDEGRALAEAMGGEGAEAAAKRVLGAEAVDPYWLDLVSLDDLGGMGLKSYLSQGYSVPDAALDANGERLQSAQGHVLILPSRAFGGAAQKLSPSAALTPLAQFDLSRDPEPATPLRPRSAGPQDAAEPRRAPPEPEPQSSSGRGRLVMVAVVVAAMAVLLAAILAG